MGNELPKNLAIGTIGEIFVQLRLLELGVQAAPPIKDSGNDLIAIRGEVVKFIQIKTSLHNEPRSRKLPKVYHLVFLVKLITNEENICFDQSKIFVINNKKESLGELNSDLVKSIWG